MQKLVNVIALLSGLVSLSVVGGGAYLYLNKDALIDQVKEKATKQITEAIAGALPGMLDSAMPELPGVTGGAVPGLPTPTPSVTGGALTF
jgi:hypothetical protein